MGSGRCEVLAPVELIMELGTQMEVEREMDTGGMQ